MQIEERAHEASGQEPFRSFQRMWDFYLGWCEGAFREHYIGAVQLLLAKQPVRERVLGEHAAASASPLSA